MSTGVKVAQETVTAFTDMKLGRSKLAMMVMTIVKGVVQVESTYAEEDFAGLSHEQRHEKLISLLNPKACAYAAIDFHYLDANNIVQTKLCLLKWIPENGPRADKMTYAASTESVKSSLQGIAKDVQANELADATYAEFLSKFQ
eukprot:c11195_g1_i1.p1 GENE.c11195_g1_i1~~c11195_g1_i1.p1  ORF type:complete len:156 (+),score=42.72 c11195_g1_i1:38-469(+)